MNLHEELTGFAVELCRGAGSILLSGFRSKSTRISYKSRTDMVTNIDRESEEFIVSEIRKKYPDHSIVAEEGSRRDASGEFKWYIDPLDAEVGALILDNGFALLYAYVLAVGAFYIVAGWTRAAERKDGQCDNNA